MHYYLKRIIQITGTLKLPLLFTPSVKKKKYMIATARRKVWSVGNAGSILLFWTPQIFTFILLVLP